MSTITSRIFTNGNSQAVRIPQEFRLNAKRVEITRTATGDLLVHPLPERRGNALLQALTGFDSDYLAALEQARATTDPAQDREPL